MLKDGKTNVSWLILVVAAIWGISHTSGRGWNQEAQVVLGTAYSAWSIFWGLPPFVRWWGRYWVMWPTMTGCLPGGCLVQILLVAVVLFVGTPFYCLCGGGVYQFVRHQLAVRRSLRGI